MAITHWQRLLKHRWHDSRDAHRAIPPAVVERLRQRVAQSETRHSGEIRICVEAALPTSYLLKKLSAHDRALMLFGKLRVWDTEHNNGVLIYVLLADRSLEIVADRGLNQHVSPEQWRSITAGMAAAFQQGRYEEGLTEAVDAVNALLVRYFALAPGQVHHNALPDQPIVQ